MNYEQLVNLHNKRRNHDVRTFEDLLDVTEVMMAMISSMIDMAKDQKRFCEEFYPTDPPLKNKVYKCKKINLPF